MALIALFGQDLANWLAPERNDLLEQRVPDTTPEDGICRRCWRRRGPGGLSGLHICSHCHCYVADGSSLDEPTYCQCQCMCNHSLELPTDDLDSDVEFTESDDSEDEEFESGSEFEISAEEVRNLHSGLSEWEVHDLERLGYPLYRLLEQFPEVETIHGRQLSPPRAQPARPFQTCAVCQKEREYLVEEALCLSHIQLCHNCQKPVVRHVADFASPVEVAQCFCHCSCPVELPEIDGDEPIFLPFVMNIPGATPSPYMLHHLCKYGFCHRNEHAEAVRAAMKTGHDIPSYEEILSNCIAWFKLQTSDQYLKSRLEALAAATTFPNGSARDRQTDSSLPKALEDYILNHIDANAFGHQTRQKWQVDGPDMSRLSCMPREEVKKWIYVDLLLQRISFLSQSHMMRERAGARFALWAVQFTDDFGLDDSEDDDRDSVCSASMFTDQTVWEEWNRAQCWCSRNSDSDSSGNGESTKGCCEREHQVRHLQRRLDRIAHRGSYPVLQEMTEWAARDALAHQERMLEADFEGSSDLFSLPFWQNSRESERARAAYPESEAAEAEEEEDGDVHPAADPDQDAGLHPDVEMDMIRIINNEIQQLQQNTNGLLRLLSRRTNSEADVDYFLARLQQRIIHLETIRMEEEQGEGVDTGEDADTISAFVVNDIDVNDSGHDHEDEEYEDDEDEGYEGDDEE